MKVPRSCANDIAAMASARSSALMEGWSSVSRQGPQSSSCGSSSRAFRRMAGAEALRRMEPGRHSSSSMTWRNEFFTVHLGGVPSGSAAAAGRSDVDFDSVAATGYSGTKGGKVGVGGSGLDARLLPASVEALIVWRTNFPPKRWPMSKSIFAAPASVALTVAAAASFSSPTPLLKRALTAHLVGAVSMRKRRPQVLS